MIRSTTTFVLVLAAALSAAQQQPRLSPDAFTYVGAFRLPRTAAGGDDFSFAGSPLAYRASANTLFAASRRGHVAEVSIPTPVNSTDISTLPIAAYVQPFADPMEGHLPAVSPNGDASLRGLAVLGGRLCGTAMIYYDALNAQRLSHFCRSLTLSTPSFSGWSSVYQPARTGWVAGWLSPVPADWQAALGGTALTGNCCVPIVTRTSHGPSAFAFNAEAIGQAQVSATPLLYYTGDHATLGPWMGSNPTYGGTTTMNGMAVIAGTRTVVYVGRNGTGPFCYGIGTTDKALIGTISHDGAEHCYDPFNSSKGPHGHPYSNQAWLYDLNDFVAVKAGTREPWDVRPYAVFPLNLPTPDRGDMGGAAYDAERQILYVSQLWADQDGYANRPLLHAFKLTVAAPPTTTAPATPDPTPVVTLPGFTSCTFTVRDGRLHVECAP